VRGGCKAASKEVRWAVEHGSDGHQAGLLRVRDGELRRAYAT
jgi:hypothetical protein